MFSKKSTDQIKPEESRWERACKAVEEVRRSSTKPDDSVFENLSRPAGGR
ncbi:MAG: hypothetical protein ABSE82_12225 [Nitrososphaerales archaeon]